MSRALILKLHWDMTSMLKRTEDEEPPRDPATTRTGLDAACSVFINVTAPMR